uniref:Ras-associating domain-containing protein n=1 Tax=Anopheles epiroticus TaxID=199890 RepID=A0A182PHI5_9DIPT
MAPQNSTLIHNDSTTGSGNAMATTATITTSAEELSNFSPILPPRNHHHHHRHHHHHHHHHHHQRTGSQRQNQPEGLPLATSSLDEGTDGTKSTTNTGNDAAGAKCTTGSSSASSGNVVASTSRGGSFRAGGVAADRELQSLPVGWTTAGCGTLPEPGPRACGTGRGTVKRELLASIPFHSHTHEVKQYTESLESDSNGTDDTDDAYDGTPEPPKAVTPAPSTEPDPTTSTTTTSDIEIPIWIRGEARFVSGINGTTTCSNIIRALIDDEIQNGNYGPEDVAVSRDVSDYVIIERWREVEQVLTGDTRILSIWDAWGDAKNEVQFRLKINKTNLEKGGPGGKENKSKKQKEKIGLINRMMRKVLKQGEAIQNHLSQISQKSTEKRQQEKFRKYVRKNCGKHLIMENFLHDAATNNLSDLSVDGEPLVVAAANEPDDSKHDAKVRRSTFPGKLLFSARKASGAAGATASSGKEKPARVLKNVLFESSDQLVDGAKANEDELLLVIDHTSDSDSGIFTNNHALSRRETLPKRPNFGSMVEIDRYTKDADELEGLGAKEEHELEDGVSVGDTAKRQQKYHRSKRRYDSLRCHHQSRRRTELEYALSEDDGVASSSGGRRSADRDQELVELVRGDDEEEEEDEEENGDGADEDFTPPVDDFESDDQFELRKGTFNRTSFRFDLIRQEIATKMAEMQQLLEQEEELLRRLKLKSAKFHAENQIYRSHIGLDFHVERLQQSIDHCAKEIIEIEQQLLETKMEIEEKSPLIDNLRALLEAQEAGQCYRRAAVKHPKQEQRYGMTTHFRTGSVEEGEALSADTSFTHAPSAGSRNSLALGKGRKVANAGPGANDSVEFVDNIYEFCDNNQSFVV